MTVGFLSSRGNVICGVEGACESTAGTSLTCCWGLLKGFQDESSWKNVIVP